MVYPREILHGVPIFAPTMEEFYDFEAYMREVNPFGMKSGIVKIIPPKEWLDMMPEITPELLKNVKIKNPIMQQISGSGGLFQERNIERQRTYNIVQWKALSQKSDHQPPAGKGKERLGGLSKQELKELEKKNREILQKNHNDEEMFEGFDHNIDTSEFTIERCNNLERAYWKSLTFNEPLYGADVEGTLFDDDVKIWNLRDLPGMLTLLDERLPGVNTTYLYAGLWKATFPWHLEDQDLYSINYLHFGAPKLWYSVPQDDKEKFDAVMKDEFPLDARKCKEFLRHKTFIASPGYLEKRGVRVNKMIHYPGEFMVTYPFGYHAGMNYGYNLAEAVNFASEGWIPFAKMTDRCQCIHDSVVIDVDDLISRYKKNLKKNGGKQEDDEKQVYTRKFKPDVVLLDSDDGDGSSDDYELSVVVPALETPDDFKKSPLAQGARQKKSSSAKVVKSEDTKPKVVSKRRNVIKKKDESESASGSKDDLKPVNDSDNESAACDIPEAFNYVTEESVEESGGEYIEPGKSKTRAKTKTRSKTKTEPVEIKKRGRGRPPKAAKNAEDQDVEEAPKQTHQRQSDTRSSDRVKKRKLAD